MPLLEDPTESKLVPDYMEGLEPLSGKSETKSDPSVGRKFVKVPLLEDPTKFKIVAVRTQEELNSMQGTDANTDLTLERHQCSNCGRSYKHLYHLKAHLRECSLEPLFSCDICHKRFYQSRNLSRHLQKVHKGVKKKESEILSESTYFVSGNPQRVVQSVSNLLTSDDVTNVEVTPDIE